MKPLSVRQLFNKSLSTKAIVSAVGFIDGYKEHLLSEELCDVTGPIITLYEQGVITASAALSRIHEVLFEYVNENKEHKSGGGKRTSKQFCAFIVDCSSGTVLTNENFDPIVKTFHLPQEAQRWLDIRLVDGRDDWKGFIKKNGEDYEEINRADSIYRILGKKKGSVIRNTSSTNKSLSYRAVVKQDKVHFSHG